MIAPPTHSIALKLLDWRVLRQLVMEGLVQGRLFVCTASPPPTGAPVELVLQLPDRSSVRLHGQALPARTTPGEQLATGFALQLAEEDAAPLTALERLARVNAGSRHPFQELLLPATLTAVEAGTVEETTLFPLPDRPTGVAAPQPEAAKRSAPGPVPPLGPGFANPLDEASELSPRLGPAPALGAPKGVRLSEQAAVFGIDFGTTFTSIALVEGEQLRVIADEEGQSLLPSVVCYKRGDPPLVGWPARDRSITAPASTISSPKRLLGRRYRDRRIEPLLASLPMRTSEGPTGEVIAEVEGQQVAITQACAEILRRASVLGTRGTRLTVRKVVLSAPVGFEAAERLALRRAAELAGLEVAAVLDEPVAAAIAWGLESARGKLVAVYDFGGGTFDFALLKVRAQGGFDVVGTGGDPWLGGDDFDLALANHIANAFWRHTKINLRERQVEYYRLVTECERAKRRLSSQPRAEIALERLVLTPAGALDLRLPLDRELLASLCGELVDRSLEPVASCLAEAGARPDQVDHVVMTGGLSRAPLVRERVQRFFGREIALKLDPELAIVAGNALHGRSLGL